MKKILMAAVALTALTATPAFAAAPAGGQEVAYAVTGSVTSQCTGLAPSGTVAYGTIGTESDGKVLATTTQSPNTLSMNVYCNSNGSKVTYSSSGTLTNASATVQDASTQTSSLGYTPVVKYAGSDVDGTNGTAVSAGALTVSATGLNSGGKIAVAGSYTGSITVTLTPGA